MGVSDSVVWTVAVSEVFEYPSLRFSGVVSSVLAILKKMVIDEIERHKGMASRINIL